MGQLISEIWKDIPGYENLYQVSNLGNIRDIRQNILQTWRNGKESKSDNYYLALNLKDINNNRKTWKVHRLVLLAFIGFSNLQVDHINGLKYDNRLINLRYCSAQENAIFKSQNNVNKICKYVGITLNKKTGKYQARARINGKRKSLGYYNTQEEAYAVYLAYI